jgi:methyl-accepting chemotaxis protein
MIWMRHVSQCNRVRLGFALCALLLAALGGWAAALLSAAGQGAAAWAVGGTGAGAALFSALAGWVVAHSIKEPVEDTVQAVIRVAGGDLETRIESPGKDELSWLRHELNSMRKKLRNTVLEVRQTVDSVTSASEEIARGNTDLSTRTESQAGALQETSSSMHQMVETVRSNAEHTSEARNMVSLSSEVAGRGERLMHEVVERMEQINQSAGRIAEIIGVIDGIAFQTNILALNAAVESARAGEHGRGFAVVASEVRSLAQRSSVAAREIKALIVDSTEKVSAGSKLVNEAGSTMGEIVKSVGRVSELMDEIAQAGQEQSRGIDRMHQAIAQIDGVTHQNAALVEQMAAASMSLKGQAERLGQAMGSFRLAA